MTIKFSLFYTLLLACLVLSGLISPVYAHHSVAGQFDIRTPVEWTGTISKMDWINPHSYIYLDVKDANDTIVTWRLETLPTAMFRKAGISKEQVMGAGQEVTIRGLPARDGTSHLGYIMRINYADGHFYQLSAESTR